MFARRYFAERYFTARYWPQSQGEEAEVVTPLNSGASFNQPDIRDPQHPYWQRRIEDAEEAPVDEPTPETPKQPERQPLPAQLEPPERPRTRQPLISEALAAVQPDARPEPAQMTAMALPEPADATDEFKARELRLIEEILLLELAA